MRLVSHDTADWAMVQATTWREASAIGKAGRVDRLGYVTDHDTDKVGHNTAKGACGAGRYKSFA